MANASVGLTELDRYCLIYRFVTDGIINWTLLFLGTIGNSLTCGVVWRDRQKSAMLLLMMNLAIVDTLTLSVWGNQYAIPSACNYFKGCEFYQRFKPIFWIYGWPFGGMFQLMGTWSIVSITLSRFVSVCWPSRASYLNSKRHVMIRTLLMHVACVVFTSPRFAEYQIIYDGKGKMSYNSTTLVSNIVYKYVYVVSFLNLCTYVIPLSLLVYFTARLIISLREMNKKRHEMSRKAKERSDLTFSLVIVVVVFIFCQLANPIRRLLYVVYAPSQLGCGTIYYYFASFTINLVNFNSACNFFIFCVCSPGFRRKLKQLTCAQQVEPINVSTTRGNTAQTST